MLSAVHAAYSRLVISTTMQHRLVSTGGSRFLFSHGFGFLLIPQMEATLMNEPVNVRIKKNILKGEEVFGLIHRLTTTYIVQTTQDLQTCAHMNLPCTTKNRTNHSKT